MPKELLLMGEQRKWVAEMKSTPGEDAVKIIKMTKKRFRMLHKLS